MATASVAVINDTVEKTLLLALENLVCVSDTHNDMGLAATCVATEAVFGN